MSKKDKFDCKSYPLNNGLDSGRVIDPEAESKSLHIIHSIRNEVEKLEGDIGRFKGHFQNEEYKRLEEILIRHMKDVEAVVGSTISEVIRKEKRRLMNYIERCEKILESKVFI